MAIVFVVLSALPAQARKAGPVIAIAMIAGATALHLWLHFWA